MSLHITIAAALAASWIDQFSEGHEAHRDYLLAHTKYEDGDPFDPAAPREGQAVTFWDDADRYGAPTTDELAFDGIPFYGAHGAWDDCAPASFCGDGADENRDRTLTFGDPQHFVRWDATRAAPCPEDRAELESYLAFHARCVALVSGTPAPETAPPVGRGGFTAADLAAVARLIDGDPEDGDKAQAEAALAKMRAIRDGLNDAVIRAASALIAAADAADAAGERQRAIGDLIQLESGDPNDPLQRLEAVGRLRDIVLPPAAGLGEFDHFGRWTKPIPLTGTLTESEREALDALLAEINAGLREGETPARATSLRREAGSPVAVATIEAEHRGFTFARAYRLTPTAAAGPPAA